MQLPQAKKFYYFLAYFLVRAILVIFIGVPWAFVLSGVVRVGLLVRLGGESPDRRGKTRSTAFVLMSAVIYFGIAIVAFMYANTSLIDAIRAAD